MPPACGTLVACGGRSGSGSSDEGDDEEFLGECCEKANLHACKAMEEMHSEPAKRSSSHDIERDEEICTQDLVLELSTLRQTDNLSNKTFHMRLLHVFFRAQDGILIFCWSLHRVAAVREGGLMDQWEGPQWLPQKTERDIIQIGKVGQV